MGIFPIFVVMRAKPNKTSFGENLLYFLVWSMALLVPFLNASMMSEDDVVLTNVLLVWSKLIPYIFIFVINNFIFAPQLLFNRRYISYFAISLLMLAAIFYSLEYYQDPLRRMVFPDGGVTYVVQGRASFTDLAWYWNVLLGWLMMGANCAIKLMFRSIQDEQKMIAMERQMLQAEMEYLKYQINPHFFMNTLNNIHAMIDFDPEAAKTSVIELSKMMRYVLYESEKAQASLTQEAHFIANYVSLMRIRYPDSVDVQLNVHHPLPIDAQVPPLLFIVFVENAFKHGVSYDEPSYVYIDLKCDNDRTICQVRNSRHPLLRVERGGVGLENVRKRLDLIFGKDYELLLDGSRSDEYIAKLSIPITYDKVRSH